MGLTGNQKSLGAGLDSIASATPGNSLILYLDSLSNSALTASYEQMSPSNLVPMFKMGFSTAQAQGTMVGQHLSTMMSAPQFTQTAFNGESPMFAGNMPAEEEAEIAQ